MSIVFLEISNLSDIFFEKAHFVLDSLGFKCLQTQTLNLSALWAAFVGLTSVCISGVVQKASASVL